MESTHRTQSRIRGAAMWLLLPRLKAPLVALIIAYSVSILGLVLIPGQATDGGVYYLSFLDAFFVVVSYTATTIGFGEIPHPFTAQQKLWMLFVDVFHSNRVALCYRFCVVCDLGPLVSVGFAPISARSVAFRAISDRFGLFADMAVPVIK